MFAHTNPSSAAAEKKKFGWERLWKMSFKDGTRFLIATIEDNERRRVFVYRRVSMTPARQIITYRYTHVYRRGSFWRHEMRLPVPRATTRSPPWTVTVVVINVAHRFFIEIGKKTVDVTWTWRRLPIFHPSFVIPVFSELRNLRITSFSLVYQLSRDRSYPWSFAFESRCTYTVQWLVSSE